MEIKKSAVVGTLESSDIMITLNPSTAGRIDIQLESSVEKQFGNQIRRVIEDTLSKLGITSVEVIAVDKGALDCTIKARVECAVLRACEASDKNIAWGGMIK